MNALPPYRKGKKTTAAVRAIAISTTATAAAGTAEKTESSATTASGTADAISTATSAVTADPISNATSKTGSTIGSIWDVSAQCVSGVASSSRSTGSTHFEGEPTLGQSGK